MLKLSFLRLSTLLLRILAVGRCVGLFACDDSEETGETIGYNCAGELKTGSTSTFSISGYVKDGKTGNKQSGSVLLYDSLGVSLLGDSSVSSSSKYSFSGLTPSWYILKADISDYTTVPDKKCLTSTKNNKFLYSLKSSDATNANVIVLTWDDDSTNDLDSHLLASGGSPEDTHIGYNGRGYGSGSGYDNASNDSQWAWIDKDARLSASNCGNSVSNCPPETITLGLDSTSGPIRNNVDKACYYVYMYSSGTWSGMTDVEVMLFQSDGTFLKNFTPPADTSTSNRYWHVFDLDSNLIYTEIKTASSTKPTCS